MDISHFKEKRLYSAEDIAPLLVFIKKLDQDKENLSNQLQIALEKIDNMEKRLQFFRNATIKRV